MIVTPAAGCAVSGGAEDAGSRAESERGSSYIATVAGVTVFLILLLFAVQVLIGLYTTSTVEGAGRDAARRVASVRVDHDDPRARAAAVDSAESQLRSILGDVGRNADIRWTFRDGSVRLRIIAETPAILPSSLRDTASLRRIDRTVTVRLEEGPR